MSIEYWDIEQLTMEKEEDMQKWYLKVADTFEKTRKLEARVATDEDLKQSDGLRYFMRESQAAKVLQEYFTLNKNE